MYSHSAPTQAQTASAFTDPPLAHPSLSLSVYIRLIFVTPEARGEARRGEGVDGVGPAVGNATLSVFCPTQNTHHSTEFHLWSRIALLLSAKYIFHRTGSSPTVHTIWTACRLSRGNMATQAMWPAVILGVIAFGKTFISFPCLTRKFVRGGWRRWEGEVEGGGVESVEWAEQSVRLFSNEGENEKRFAGGHRV